MLDDQRVRLSVPSSDNRFSCNWTNEMGPMSSSLGMTARGGASISGGPKMNLESGKATAAGNVERSVPIKPLGPAASIDLYASAGFEVDTSTGEPDGVVEIGISVGAGMGKMRQNFFKVGVGVTTSGEKFFTVQALPYYGSLRCVEYPNPDEPEPNRVM
mgnify:CR=1 FL=1